MADPAVQQVVLGRSLRGHFDFPAEYVPLNQGSFGAYPRSVGHALREYQTQANAQPDTFIRFEYPGLLRAARTRIAKLLHAPSVDEVVLVPNVTTAFNTVVRALRWQRGDVIVVLDTVYTGLAKTLAYLAETTSARIVTVDTADDDDDDGGGGGGRPLDDAQLVRRFTAAIEHINAGGAAAENDSSSRERVRMAVFDTVSSLPGARLPFVALVQACREQSVLSFLDGAHGLGQIPLDLAAIDADFFATNLHKWLFVPRGCAALHVPRRHQGLIRSSVPTSHGFRPLEDATDSNGGGSGSGGGSSIGNPLPPSSEPPFVELFEFVGTLDSSNYLCIPAALAFRRDVCGGEARVMEYLVALARRGGDAAAALLGTEVMDNRSGTLRDCAFANVKLPLAVQDVGDKADAAAAAVVVQWIAKRSVERNTMLVTIFYHGSWWWRISAAVYLDLDDILYGAKLLKDLCEQLKRGGLEV